MTGELISLLVRLLAIFLLLTGMASFAILVKGSFALRRMARATPRDESITLLKSRLAPAVSVIFAPPHAREESIAMARLLVGLHFGNHEVIVGLDGPNDAELSVWREAFNLAPTKRPVAGPLPSADVRTAYESRDPIRLVVLQLKRSGPASALNACVNASQAPVLGMFDHEAEFQPEILLRMVRPMLDEPGQTLAICGVEAPPPSGALPDRLASLSFLRMWLSRCSAFAAWNILLPVSGSAILILREAAIKAGGFEGGVQRMFLRLHRMARATGQPYRIVFLPEPGCRRRSPPTMTELRRLIIRDQREVVRMILMPRSMPWWTSPALLVVRIIRPLAEFAALLLTLVGLVAGWVDWHLAALVLLSTVGTGLLLSMGAVSLRELSEYRGSDPARLSALFFAAIPESLWFRQVRNLWLITAFAKRVDW